MAEEMRQLGESEEPVPFSTAAENREIARQMAAQARRSLHLFTADLDPLVYDEPGFVEAAARMARSHPRARVLVLVHDADLAAKRGHRLVTLAQRLSSRVEIRKTPAEFVGSGDTFLVADTTGYLRRPIASRFEGEACFRDPFGARGLQERFEEAWERAHADPQLRRLRV
jgi:hypothetical protein